MALQFLKSTTKISNLPTQIVRKSSNFFRAPEQLNNAETQITRLPSGLRVATQPGNNPNLATVGLWIEAGSAYETEEMSGASNMLQNLAWRGTPNKDRQALAKEVESTGANLSSYTSREHTAYFAETSLQAAPQTFAALADIVQNKTFSDENVEIARSAAVQQAQNFRHQLDDVLFDHVHSIAYQRTGLANPVVGEVKNLKRIRGSDIGRFASRYYTAPRTVVVGVGVPHQEFVKTVEQTLNLPSSNPPPEDGYIDWLGSELRIRDDTMHEVHSMITWEAVPYTHPHYWTFLVIQALTGSWDNYSGGSSNLSSRLSEMSSLERLGHSYQAFYSSYRNTGVFGVYAVGNESNIDDLVYAIFNTYQIALQYLNADELFRAKSKAKIALLSQLHGNTATANDIGRSVLLGGRHVSVAEAYARLDSVEMSDITEALKTYFFDIDPTVVALGPLEYFPDYVWSRAWTFWNRW